MSEQSEQSPAASTPVSTGESGEWEQRTLCPDESCLGVLGPDGRCCLCGLRGDLSRPQGLAPSSPSASPPSVDSAALDSHGDGDSASDSDSANDSDSDSANDEAPAASTISTGAGSDGSDDFSQRELCPNDECIGVLGPDRACKLCGRRRDSQS